MPISAVWGRPEADDDEDEDEDEDEYEDEEADEAVAAERKALSTEELRAKIAIDGEVVGIESGPVITLYDVRLAPGTKVAQLRRSATTSARALKAVNVRIVTNQLGRDTVGVEVPNPTKEKVRLRELMSNPERYNRMKLPMFLGKDASGEPLISDLAEMPHMLIAGTTGSGKSVLHEHDHHRVPLHQEAQRAEAGASSTRRWSR
jgi:S-DNA-T family DNA segregation ATPase FtsK/SpoIIIE